MIDYIQNVSLEMLSLGGFLVIGSVAWIMFLVMVLFLVSLNQLTYSQERTMLHILVGSLIGIVAYAILTVVVSITSPSNTPKNTTFERMELAQPVLIPVEPSDIRDLTDTDAMTDQERQQRFESSANGWKNEQAR